MARDWLLDDVAKENFADEKSSLLDKTVDGSLATDSSPDNAGHGARGQSRQLAMICSFALIVLVLRIVLGIDLLTYGMSGSTTRHHDTYLIQAHRLLEQTPLIGTQA